MQRKHYKNKKSKASPVKSPNENVEDTQVDANPGLSKVFDS
jgi:hypothetical protein